MADCLHIGVVRYTGLGGEVTNKCHVCGKAWVSPCGKVLPEKKEPMMKKGEVRKLPEKSSPMWTTQWAYQGSGQDTYIISRRHVAKIIEWACSCPAWTKKTPREHCKHILKMMLLEKLPVANLATGLPKDQQELFMKFLKQQAAAGTPVLEAGAAKPLVRQGRRFR